MADLKLSQYFQGFPATPHFNGFIIRQTLSALLICKCLENVASLHHPEGISFSVTVKEIFLSGTKFGLFIDYKLFNCLQVYVYIVM